MKIISIVGTRPQFLKLAPLSKKINKEDIEHIVVHTGQHYDKEMSNNLFDVLKMKEPDYLLEKKGETNIQSLGNMMNELEIICLKEKPDKLIVFGDCDTTIAGAIVARKLNIYLIHIEAGMRSYNKDMPEEVNRLMTDHISDLLLCSTQDSIDKLKQENITKNVHYVGNLQLELLKNVCETYNDKSILTQNKLTENNFALMTIHREYNTNEKMLKNIFSKLEKLDIAIVFPIHPRTKNIIKNKNIDIPKNLKLIKPVDYLNMTILERNCKFIITDSGGIQPEAWFLGKKCIIMRSETEWIEPLKNNNSILYDYKTPLNEFIKDFLQIQIDEVEINSNVSSNINLLLNNNINMPKKKLYYLLGNRSKITAKGGDGINEINNIKYLSNFYDIFYNNQKLDFTLNDLGQTNNKINVPNQNYDIYYVRNNKEIFLKTPKDKIKVYFASPYDEDCFKYADYINCLTQNWKNMLLSKNDNWGILYPKNYYTNKAIVLSQKIDPKLFYPIENINYFNNINDDTFKICHFGSFRNSCYPSFILRLYASLNNEERNKIKIIFIGNIPNPFKKDNPDFLYIKSISLEQVNNYINSCQLLLYNQRDYQSEYAGSNKIIEAIICNKPILSVRSQARIEELGINYPLFYDLLIKPPDNPKNIFKDNFICDKEVIRIKNIIINMIENKKYYNKIVDYMKNINKEQYLTTFKTNQLNTI